MTSETYVLDTTVIINLATVRQPLRQRIVAVLAGICWVAMEVDEELRDGVRSPRRFPGARNARTVGLAMRQGPDDDEALIITGDDLRVRIARPGDPTHRHLGEAGSAALAARDGHVLVSDDRSAAELARITGIRTVSTAGLLSGLVRHGLLTCRDASAAHREIVDAGRFAGSEARVC